MAKPSYAHTKGDPRRRSARGADCSAVLGLCGSGRTRYALCERCAQTAARSQTTKALARPRKALRSSTAQKGPKSNTVVASQSEQIPASRTCIDKKVGKEATPADSALAMRGLPCAARSLRVGQNSLRGLRPLRSNSRPKSAIDARCARPAKPCAAQLVRRGRRHQPASLRSA